MKENGIGSYRLGRRQFLAASALASAGLLLSGCRQEAAQQASQGGGGGAGGSGGNFPDTPEWNFVFVNHVTTNPFFVPTQYGIEDAQAGHYVAVAGVRDLGRKGDGGRDELGHLGRRGRDRCLGGGP
jgi:ABC-type sugar transport system substrate-binding protein